MTIMTSCGSKSDKVPEEVALTNSELSAAMEAHDLEKVSLMADSMANYLDDLTCDETVTVLLAFLEVHNDAAERKDSQLDLLTIRKFIDVYDIATQLNPNDFPKAVQAARNVNPSLDLEAIARQFRDRLAEYDALQNGDEVSAPTRETTDSATIKVVKPGDSDADNDGAAAPESVKPIE